MRARIDLRNLYHRHLPNIPFTYGIPVPKGIAPSAADIALVDSKRTPVPVAVQPMATWPDGSIRWALLDFSLDFSPNENRSLEAVLGEKIVTPLPTNPVIVRETADEIRVSNGRLEAVFDKSGPFRIITSLMADGVEVIGPAQRCDIVALSPGGKVFRATYDPKPTVSLEETTPNRVVVRWDGGLYAGDGARLTEFRLKLHFYPGNPYIRMDHSAVNREMPEAGVELYEYRIELETAMAQTTTKVVRQKNHGTDYLSRMVELRQNVDIRVPTVGESNDFGAAIGSLGVVGKCVLQDEAAFQESVGDFPHFLKPGAPRVAVSGGYGVVYPFLGVRDEQRTAVVALLQMGPQHPKSLHADENRIIFHLWPPTSGKTWRLCRGMTKTHKLALSFFGRALSADEIDNEAVRHECFTGGGGFDSVGICPHDPVSITLDRDYVRQTRQVEAHKLLPYLPQRYPKLETKLANLKLHGNPLAFSGIMDFGEGTPTNNEEDQGHEYAMESYRSASYPHYLKFMAQMLHNSTVDVVCWDPDPLRQGGTPYHTSYHQDAVCVPSHTWTEGMLEYAYVSGDRDAFKAAVEICEWILRFMRGKPHLVKQDGREIGWALIALVAGYQATWDQRYRDGAYELVGCYQQKIAEYGELANNEPPGTAYHLAPYGEYAGFEGMHKLWEVTGDEHLRTFALNLIESFIEKGHISFYSHGRFMDLYALYAAYDMSKDMKWIERAKQFLPVALARPNWDGYFYRRIIHFLGMCHDHGLIDDSLVALKD